MTDCLRRRGDHVEAAENMWRRGGGQDVSIIQMNPGWLRGSQQAPQFVQSESHVQFFCSGKENPDCFEFFLHLKKWKKTHNLCLWVKQRRPERRLKTAREMMKKERFGLDRWKWNEKPNSLRTRDHRETNKNHTWKRCWETERAR